MEVPGNLRVVCRLCWSYDLSVHWEDDMTDFNCLSYKECFFKYTLFEENATDHLSQYLCEECAAIIKNFHLMVEKSVETLQFCEHVAVENGSSKTNKSDNNSIVDISLEQSNTDDQGHEIYEIIIESDEKLDFRDNALEGEQYEKCFGNSTQRDCEVLCLSASSENLPDSTGNDDIFCQESDRPNNSHEIERDGISQSSTTCEVEDEPSERELNSVDLKLATTQETKAISPAICDTRNKNLSQDSDEKSSVKVAKTPGMCSYCSKIVHDIYYLKLHEQTHEENRQREVSCSKCGLKLYHKRSLYQHMKIHEENRIKKYKCEFCDKAFYSRGSCNIHRRIHLGQMYQCPLCPKQFYRQIELNRHMPSHSHETLSSRNQDKPKKYYVHCKECDRKIASNRFSGHRASHIKEPFMQCTLCQKDFYSRKSGGKHMACVHKRKGGDYDDITLYYQNKERPRLTLLLTKQQEDVEPAE